MTASGKIRQPGYGGVAIARVCRVGSAAIAASASSNLVFVAHAATTIDSGCYGQQRSAEVAMVARKVKVMADQSDDC